MNDPEFKPKSGEQEPLINSKGNGQAFKEESDFQTWKKNENADAREKEIESVRGEISAKIEDSGEKTELSKEKSDKKENSELKLEDKIFEGDFNGKYNEIMSHEFTIEGKDGEKTINLKKIVAKYSGLALDSLASEKNREDFVKELVEQISKIPNDKWSINFNHAIESGKMNCSNCASLIGLILEKNKEKFGIQNIEYGMPYGHALVIITFSGGKVFYVDSRNNAFENLEVGSNTKIEERNGLRVYKISQLKGRMGYNIIPTLDLKEGILSSYLSNLDSARKTSEGKFDDEDKLKSEEEQLQSIKAAKKIIQEMRLSDKDKKQYEKLKDLFSGKIDKYVRTGEFKSEIKRWQKVERLSKGLDPIRKLMEKDKNLFKELVSKKKEIISFLNFSVNDFSINNEQVELELKKFRKNSSGLKNNPEYKEFVRQVEERLK
jgi:hypothetical protein